MKKPALSENRRQYRMGARADAAQATVDRLLDVAVELFTAAPYEEVSLDEVAARAEVTKRTLLRRFGSKNALFGQAMQRAVGQMIGHLEAAPVGDVEGAVANVVAHYERWGANRLRLLAQEDGIPTWPNGSGADANGTGHG